MWELQNELIPFNDLFRTSSLRLTDIDVVPDADQKGRRRPEGWTVSWEGVVDRGESRGSAEWSEVKANLCWVFKQLGRTVLGLYMVQQRRGYSIRQYTPVPVAWAPEDCGNSCTSAALIGLHTPTFWGPPMLSGVSLAIDMQYFAPALLSVPVIPSARIQLKSH